jgi:hypothetical protein
MQDDRRRVAALPRRLVLKALAAAPAALAAGCAAVSAEQAPDGGGPTGGGPGAVVRAPAADEALAAIRGFPLAPDAEPAFVFRAGAVRPGDPR